MSTFTELLADAEHGDPFAQFKVAVMYLDGDGIDRDELEGAKWLTCAAEQGHIGAQFHLGNLYFFGGHAWQEKESAKKANMRVKRRANALADSLAPKSVSATPGEDSIAMILGMFAAARADDEELLAELAATHAERDGIAKNHLKAIEWYRMAAMQGHDEAQKSMGDIMSDGLGVASDSEEARKWYQLAADQGNMEAQTCLGLIK